MTLSCLSWFLIFLPSVPLIMRRYHRYWVGSMWIQVPISHGTHTHYVGAIVYRPIHKSPWPNGTAVHTHASSTRALPYFTDQPGRMRLHSISMPISREPLHFTRSLVALTAKRPERHATRPQSGFDFNRCETALRSVTRSCGPVAPLWPLSTKRSWYADVSWHPGTTTFFPGISFR